VNRAQIAFGIFTVMVGVGIGYFMYTSPEGLNPQWPLGMALLAPAVFVLGGLHIIAASLNQLRFANAMLLAVVFGLFAIVHWAAFFTKNFQCVATISFLGAEVFEWYPSEMECRYSLRVIMAIVDALVVIVVGVAWHRYRASRCAPRGVENT
jgi:hypothetical protein